MQYNLLQNIQPHSVTTKFSSSESNISILTVEATNTGGGIRQRTSLRAKVVVVRPTTTHRCIRYSSSTGSSSSSTIRIATRMITISIILLSIMMMIGMVPTQLLRQKQRPVVTAWLQQQRVLLPRRFHNQNNNHHSVVVARPRQPPQLLSYSDTTSSTSKASAMQRSFSVSQTTNVGKQTRLRRSNYNCNNINYKNNQYCYRLPVRFMTTSTTTSSTNHSTTPSDVTSLPQQFTTENQNDDATMTTSFGGDSIVGIEYIQNCVVEVLNELYHPQEIARGRIIAKLLSASTKNNNKTKKKNKNSGDVHNNQKKTKASQNITNRTVDVALAVLDDDEDDTTTTDMSSSRELTVNEINALVDAELLLVQQPNNRDHQPPQSVVSSSSSSSVSSSSSFTKHDAAVTTATRSDFGDYQCNAAMTLATSLSAIQQLEQLRQQQQQQQQMSSSTNDTVASSTSSTTTRITPRSIAETIVKTLGPKLQHIIELPMEIAGPGFINMKLSKPYLSHAVHCIVSDPYDRLGIPLVTSSSSQHQQRQRIVVDFSSPNIAKEMHVGHLRSTIIGDTLCNVLEFIGHDVVRLNHIGDWGTQFGMLVEHLRDEFPAALDPVNADSIDLGDLVVLYKAAKHRFDVDDDFKQRAREGVVKLQAGDVESLAAWKSLCSTSRIEYQKIYDMLNIKGLNERGESFYNPYLSNVIQDLEDQGLAVESDGALAVFLDGYRNRDGTPLPMLVRKSDGGYNYATTDLAAIRHRTSMDDGEKANRVLYVTDTGQSQHFDMVFQVAKKAKFVADTSSLEHVPFGLVQGEDGKKFATRSGDTVKLKDLLNEAILIAGKDLRERTNNDTSSEEFLNRVDRVARIVGIGAVKYADLSMNRESNYRFSYERMLSLNGNTAPYMLYAYARICSIVRKASGQVDDGTDIVWPEVASEILISHESEYDLMRNLVKLSDVINEVERELYPNRICDYLFETSQKFNKFYENCSVNNAETPALKASRLSLCTATARTIRLLLTLLGIEVVDKL